MRPASQRRAWLWVAALVITADVLATPAAATELELRQVGGGTTQPATWVSTGGKVTASGSDRFVRISIAAGADRRSIEREHGAPVTDGTLAGDRLFLIEDRRRLLEVPVDAPGDTPAFTHALSPAARGDLHVVVTGNVLAVAEDGVGVRLLRLAPRHDPATHGRGHGATRLAPWRVVDVPGRIAALAGSWPRLYVVVLGRGILEIDVRGETPVSRRVSPVDSLHALAVVGRDLVGLGPVGLRLVPIDGGRSVVDPRQRSIRGDAIAVVGRALYVASRSEGVRRYRNETAGGQTIPVIVGNNFFQPDVLVAEVGDTVQWTNAAGFHNVASCQPDRAGCDGADSNELFYSGPPENPVWVHSHTFAEIGSNPYLCDSHFQFMQGVVTVDGPLPGPPVIPDGSPGSPMLVAKPDPAGAALEISWDTQSCAGALDHQMLYGNGAQLPTQPGGAFQLSGAVCALGLTSPFAWSVSPTVGPGELLWWIVVSTNGSSREGSWGAAGSGIERRGPAAGGSSGQCGVVGKDLTNPCAQ